MGDERFFGCQCFIWSNSSVHFSILFFSSFVSHLLFIQRIQLFGNNRCILTFKLIQKDCAIRCDILFSSSLDSIPLIIFFDRINGSDNRVYTLCCIGSFVSSSIQIRGTFDTWIECKSDYRYHSSPYKSQVRSYSRPQTNALNFTS